MNECPICKQQTHWNCIDIEGDDPLYQCVQCHAQASKRTLLQLKLYQVGLARLTKQFPGATLQRISMTGWDLLAWLDPSAPQGVRSIQMETLNIQAIVDATEAGCATWADVLHVYETIRMLVEPDSTEIVASSHLRYDVVSLALTVLIQLGYIRQKEDTCDHCWRYRAC